MLCFGLISSDAALSHAISEQLRQAPDDAWQFALFPSLEDALAAWGDNLPPLIFWDAQEAAATEEMAAFFAHRLGQSRPAPLLLVLGDLPAPLANFGATELFTRPLRLGYFLTRLQFYRRVLAQESDVSFSLGPWLFKPRERTIGLATAVGEPVKLTEKESDLLAYLCAAEGPVSREELLAVIWGYAPQVDTHTLETHIYRLRRKLMAHGGEETDVFAMEKGTYRLHAAWRSADKGAS